MSQPLRTYGIGHTEILPIFSGQCYVESWKVRFCTLQDDFAWLYDQIRALTKHPPLREDATFWITFFVKQYGWWEGPTTTTSGYIRISYYNHATDMKCPSFIKISYGCSFRLVPTTHSQAASCALKMGPCASSVIRHSPVTTGMAARLMRSKSMAPIQGDTCILAHAGTFWAATLAAQQNWIPVVPREISRFYHFDMDGR